MTDATTGKAPVLICKHVEHRNNYGCIVKITFEPYTNPDGEIITWQEANEYIRQREQAYFEGVLMEEFFDNRMVKRVHHFNQDGRGYKETLEDYTWVDYDNSGGYSESCDWTKEEADRYFADEMDARFDSLPDVWDQFADNRTK